MLVGWANDKGLKLVNIDRQIYPNSPFEHDYSILDVAVMAEDHHENAETGVGWPMSANLLSGLFDENLGRIIPTCQFTDVRKVTGTPANNH